MYEVFQLLDFVSDAVYVDLKYDDVFILWLIVVCEWVVTFYLCLALLLRVVGVCEWCLSSRVCIVVVCDKEVRMTGVSAGLCVSSGQDLTRRLQLL